MQSAAFIGRQTAAGKPFFLYLAHTMPQVPVYPSNQTFANAEGSTWPKFEGASGISSCYDIVMATDHSVHRIFSVSSPSGLMTTRS